MPSQIKQSGFSLVEVLITLAIMGVVAAFAIPKVMNPTGSATNKSAKQTTMAREVAFMILGAYEQYKAVNGTVPITVSPIELSPYMNYLSVDLSSNIDGHPWWTTAVSCSNISPCLKLHDGGVLMLTGAQFGSTDKYKALRFFYDPDGVYSGTGAVQNNSKSLEIFLYYDGVLRNRGDCRENTANTWTSGIQPNINMNPIWFTGY